jgi:hypothetical protein
MRLASPSNSHHHETVIRSIVRNADYGAALPEAASDETAVQQGVSQVNAPEALAGIDSRFDPPSVHNSAGPPEPANRPTQAGAASTRTPGTPGLLFLSLEPPRPTLRGPATQQLVVMGYFDGGRVVDVSQQAGFECADESVARVTTAGVITPTGDGSTEVLARLGGKTAQAVVSVAGFREGLTVNFANDIAPIFTRLGCNNGQCHGKAGGQNGFKLSLLGFDPEADYEAVVKEARGRRVFPSAPEMSLLLRKPTLSLPHGGGKRLGRDAEEYETLRRWIAVGMPYGQPEDARVVGIKVWPPDRVMERRDRQQLVVTAQLSDGSSRDVTRRAQYQSQAPEIAQVNETGLVETYEFAGATTVMARYQGHVTVFRATLPQRDAAPRSREFEPATYIDRLVAARWSELGLRPSSLCSDEQFIRRASLDICGVVPRPAEVESFLTDPDPNKRARLTDRLLERPEYATLFALKWSDVLRNGSRNDDKRRPGTIAFYNFIRTSIAQDKPLDQFASEILTAQGAIGNNPAVVWWRDLLTPAQMVENTAQAFLGVRVQCAQCHHHPFERWGQEDYFGLAAFFARVGRQGNDAANPTLVLNPQGEATHPRTGQVIRPRGLNGPELDIAANEDRRARLVAWLRQPDNPFFARALVNRVWAHFFSRGIVDPIDDMRVTNPPTNPQLFDTLAQDFVRGGFRVKPLVRAICTSRTYQLSSEPTEHNKDDAHHFARYYPKRMAAEVLYDAVSDVTNSYPQFAIPGLPQPVRRALELPDEAPGNYFLRVFGKPLRETSCDCERTTDANLAQVLHLISSEEVQAKIAAQAPPNTPPAQQPRALQLASDPRPEADKVRELFLWAFARLPDADELASALNHLAARADNKQKAYEDLLWALINAKEFQFIL